MVKFLQTLLWGTLFGLNVYADVPPVIETQKVKLGFVDEFYSAHVSSPHSKKATFSY